MSEQGLKSSKVDLGLQIKVRDICGNETPPSPSQLHPQIPNTTPTLSLCTITPSTLHYQINQHHPHTQHLHHPVTKCSNTVNTPTPTTTAPTSYTLPQYRPHPIPTCPNTTPILNAPTPSPPHLWMHQNCPHPISACLNTITPSSFNAPACHLSPYTPTLSPSHPPKRQHHAHPITDCSNTIHNPSLISPSPSTTHLHLPICHPQLSSRYPNSIDLYPQIPQCHYHRSSNTPTPLLQNPRVLQHRLRPPSKPPPPSTPTPRIPSQIVTINLGINYQILLELIKYWKGLEDENKDTPKGEWYGEQHAKTQPAWSCQWWLSG